MKFRDYCLVLMGKNENVLPEIIKIAESKPNILDAKGIVIATFTSVMEVEEISDYLKTSNRNFLLFDLAKDNSGFNITKPEVYEGLFGFLDGDRSEYLKERSEELLHEIGDTSGSTNTYTNENDLTLRLPIDDVSKLTLKERDEWINVIIDTGVDKLSDYDKKLLEKLSSD